MTREEATKLVKFAWSQWPNKAVDEFAVEAFFQALCDEDFKDCWRGVVECFRHEGREFAPTTGEILRELRAARRRERSAVPRLPEPEKYVSPEKVSELLRPFLERAK